MTTYRKKPILVEAWQWPGNDDSAGAPAWIRNALNRRILWFSHDSLNTLVLVIGTLEGIMIVRPSDWIIRGVAGELYPRKPEIFEQTYEAVPSPVIAQRRKL